MPVKKSNRTLDAKKYYQNTSFEIEVCSWLLRDGWEVFQPFVDHDSKTDLLISDGNNFYRIQIKTIETNDESVFVQNMWGEVKIDFVIYFSKSAGWGFIMKPFTQNKKRLNAEGHLKFHQHPKPFIKAFNNI